MILSNLKVFMTLNFALAEKLLLMADMNIYEDVATQMIGKN